MNPAASVGALLAVFVGACAPASQPIEVRSQQEIVAGAVDTYRRELLRQNADHETERIAAAAARKAECAKKGGADIGMTRAELYASCWGKPQRINATTNANGAHEQLIYRGGYVYLDNGIVRSIQTSH